MHKIAGSLHNVMLEYSNNEKMTRNKPKTSSHKTFEKRKVSKEIQIISKGE